MQLALSPLRKRRYGLPWYAIANSQRKPGAKSAAFLCTLGACRQLEQQRLARDTLPGAGWQVGSHPTFALEVSIIYGGLAHELAALACDLTQDCELIDTRERRTYQSHELMKKECRTCSCFAPP